MPVDIAKLALLVETFIDTLKKLKSYNRDY